MNPAPPALPEGAVLALRGFGIAYGDRQVLQGVDLTLPGRGVTVLLGPSGTGKSTLLRTLAGENDTHPARRLEGSWSYAGAPARPPLVMQKARLLMTSVFESLVQDWPERARLTAAEQQARVRQWLATLGQARLEPLLRVPVVELPAAEQRLVAVLRVALHDTPLMLVDEPTAGLPADEAEPLLALMRLLGTRRALLVVMHHLAQSRSLADDVLLLASRRVQEHTAAGEFFAQPRSESGRLFLRTGSCPEEPLHPLPEPAPAAAEPAAAPATAPAPVPVPLPLPMAPRPAAAARPRTRGPNGFAWMIDGQLAGTPWPGLVHPAEYDLALLRDVGVTRLLSLTDRPFDAALAAAHGITVANLPVVDMRAPTPAQALALCAQLDAWLAAGEVVAVHCRAGLGRTGTVLAAHWLWRQQGRADGAMALQHARRHHPGWVQSAVQIEFLQTLATLVASHAGPTGNLPPPPQPLRQESPSP